MNRAADAITRVAHPDANIIFGAVVDDGLGEEVRVTVIAAGFEKPMSAPTTSRFESRLSRLLDEPEPVSVVREPATSTVLVEEKDDEHMPMPSILIEEEDEIFKPAAEDVVSFDAEEDLDIPDFLKS